MSEECGAEDAYQLHAICDLPPGHAGYHSCVHVWEQEEEGEPAPPREPCPAGCGCVSCVVKKIWAPTIEQHLLREVRMSDFLARRAD